MVGGERGEEGEGKGTQCRKEKGKDYGEGKEERI